MGSLILQPTRQYSPGPGYEQNVMSLLLNRGDIAGRGALMSGQAWGRAAEQIGNLAAGAVQQIHEQKAQKAQALAVNEALSSYNPEDPTASYRKMAVAVGPERAVKIMEGIEKARSMAVKSQQGQAPTINEFNTSLTGLHALAQSDPEFMPTHWNTVRQIYGPGALAHYGYELPEQYDPKVAQHLDSLAGVLDKSAATGQPLPVPQPDGSTKFYERDPKTKAWVEAPGLPTAAPKPSPLQHVETAAGIQTFDPAKGTLGPVIAQGKPPASLIVNPQKEEDTETNAQSMVDGRILPSQFSKRGSDFNHLLATADRKSVQQTGKHFNASKLVLDYEAAKRFIGGMNGPQMIRFKALATSVVNTMDEVKSLAEELKQGGVQKWNQAKRDTVLQVYGNTPQSALAARYVSAVNTLKEEFANLAQGGYAPTEDAWKLANQQINGNFGLKDMDASLTEAQRLINYRMGAFQELTPTFVGGQGTMGEALGNAAPAAPAPKKNPFR